jgi:hypothetical protein
MAHGEIDAVNYKVEGCHHPSTCVARVIFPSTAHLDKPNIGILIEQLFTLRDGARSKCHTNAGEQNTKRCSVSRNTTPLDAMYNFSLTVSCRFNFNPTHTMPPAGISTDVSYD